ncbi:hypothetical protein C8Q76DRAFT_789709 [Earliella scabrosa]|nr:hypothetical protein C8Q76DRAFT_789709 [Earliella scabrosa]
MASLLLPPPPPGTAESISTLGVYGAYTGYDVNAGTAQLQGAMPPATGPLPHPPSHLPPSTSTCRSQCCEHEFHELDQRRYQRGHILLEECRLPTSHFHGFSLRDAFTGNARSLRDHGRLAWPESFQTSQKYGIVFWFEDRDVYNKQVTLRTAGNKPPRLERLAQAVAVELQKLMNERPLYWEGRLLSLDDLVLMRVEHVSKGSLQPVIAVRRRSGFPT